MAGRDPTRPQLEFPALVAELITQLRLSGQVGRLNFSDEVIPAFLIGSRGINFSGDAVTFGSPSVLGNFVSLPVASTVIFDTGPLPAGDYDIWAEIHMFGSIAAGGQVAILEHRNAGNTATLANLLLALVGTLDRTVMVDLPLLGYTLGLNERIRLRSPTVNMTAGALGGNLMFQIRPTP